MNRMIKRPCELNVIPGRVRHSKSDKLQHDISTTNALIHFHYMPIAIDKHF